MSQKKVSTVVSVPETYEVGDRTEGTNRLLKEAGTALKAIPLENTRLRKENMELSEKLSSSQREVGLLQLAAERSAQGLIATTKISSTAARWAASEYGVDHWREVTDGMLNPSFATSEGAGEAAHTSKQSSDLDNLDDASHNGDANGFFDHNSVSHWLRQRAS